MLSNLLDNPTLFRHVLEDLPVGIYILDRERRIRFWNRGAEQLTGYLGHEVVGHFVEDVLQACDQHGNRLHGENCPVTMTLHHGQPQQCTAFYLHKDGHREPMSIRTRPMLDPMSAQGDAIGGTTVLFEQVVMYHEEISGAPISGCLDATTGTPSRRLTQAVLNECMVSSKESRQGFGVVRIRVLGLEEFRAKHGRPSAVPFLRAAAQTLRHNLDAESFLGRWEDSGFLVVLPTGSPVTVAATAETLRAALSHSEVSWWGDHFVVEAEVACTVVATGDDIESLLREMKPTHSSRTPKTMAAANTKTF